MNGLKEWLATGNVTHDQSHVHPLPASLPQEEEELGVALARALQHRPAILAVLDEGCMGMYNAIIDDEMLNACGIYKERLSQAALVAGMRKVTHEEASEALQWLKEKGMTYDPACCKIDRRSFSIRSHRFRVSIGAWYSVPCPCSAGRRPPQRTSISCFIAFFCA